MKHIFGALKGMLSRIHWRQFAVACSAVVILMTANGVKAQQNTGNRAYSNELPPTQEVGRPRTMG